MRRSCVGQSSYSPSFAKISVALSYSPSSTSFNAYFAINVGKIIRLHRSHKCHQRYALTVSVIVCVLLHGLLDISMLWPQTGLLVIYIVGFSTEYDKQHIFGTDRRHEIFALHARSIQAKEPIL